MNKLFTVFKGEFKSQFTPGKMVGMLFTILIPLLIPAVSGELKASDTKTLEQETWTQLGRLFAEGIMYAMIFRIINVLKDGTTLDKNRISYLTHSKGKVLFAKVFSDSLQFLMTISITIVAGTALIVFKNNGQLNAEFYERTAIYLFTMFAVYLAATIGMRYIQYVVKNKTFRIVGLSIWIAATLVAYIVLAIITGVVTDVTETTNSLGKTTYVRTYPIMDFAMDNKYWVSFVPFLNLINVPLMIYGQADLWMTAPIIGYTIIGTVLVWRKLSTAAKEFLCA